MVSLVDVLDVVSTVNKHINQSSVSRRDGLVLEPVINLCLNLHKHPQAEPQTAI